MGAKRRIAILGGGVGALTTAFELTNSDGWQDQYDITVYQLGWRLGGKGASGRNHQIADRIEEHGLHVWLGFYENAFHLIRQAYDECAQKNLAPDSPFRTWQDAFLRQDSATNMEQTPQGWAPWTLHFCRNDQLPGEPALFDRKEGPPTAWDLMVMAVERMCRKLTSIEEILSTPRSPLRNWLSGRLHRLAWWHVPGWISSVFYKLAMLVESAAFHVLADVVKALDPDPSQHTEEMKRTLLGLLERITGKVLCELEKLADQDASLRHILLLVDSAIAMVRGIIVDGVLTSGFERIDKFDLIEWLTRNGCRNPRNPFVRAGYSALFAYYKGDPQQPNVSAATAVYGILRMMFTYRGSMFWRLKAGMGDTIFAPLYLVLKARKVKFEFFHRVTNVGLNREKSLVETVTFDVQATLRNPCRSYQPLYAVKGLPCWPNEPFYNQLVDGDMLAPFDLESDYTPWHGRNGSKTLQRGLHFDDVVLGIPPGATCWICRELAAARPEWANMLTKVATVQTQAMQFWLHETSVDLGYPVQPDGEKPAVTAFVEPYDTWADMTHVIPMENWRLEDDVKSIAYFCNAFQDAARIPPPFTDPEFPAQQLERVRRMALQFLNGRGDIQVLWPNCGLPFQWNLFVDRYGQRGDTVLNSQFFRANIDGTERYVLSVKGSGPFRLHPGNSGFANLFLAGDWTYNVLNAGCVEAAVISGRLASHAICGKPEHIYGAFGSKEKAYWTEQVMQGMPPEIEVEQHCRAIAAKYARFYLEHPEIYLMPGAAAFAVHRISLVLALYDFEVADGEVKGVAQDYNYKHGREVLFNDLNHLRKVNNEFFKDVGWTFEAYSSPEPGGGIGAIEAGLAGDADHEELLGAWRKIDKGRKLLDCPATRQKGETLIWEGNLMIEHHGQIFSAQKFYDEIKPEFDLFMTVFTTMNFEAASFKIMPGQFTWFYLFMWTRGILKLISTFSGADLRKLDQRWYWISKRVFPIWGKVIKKDPTLARNLQAIVRAAPPSRTASSTAAGHNRNPPAAVPGGGAEAHGE
jgi:uncharacterized protein with NAD-binding domain and iron-sulfur cluster